MSDPLAAPLLRHARTGIHGRYLVRPARAAPPCPWLVGFHGQGQTADALMPALERCARRGHWLIASVQGLHRHYAGRSRAVVASWMTSQDRELAIRDNLEWVDTVLDALEREFGPPRAIVFAGFSQGVAMAYRAGLLGRRACAAVIAGCGDVPPELASGHDRPWPRVLAAAGTRDEWYTPARLAADADMLRALGADARALVFEGGHEWSDALTEAAGAVLDEVLRDAAT
uniref:Phospholipase n=1 Tax=Eiseniibacteriota bacterium TaxID=2212470 RepID=A0A832MKS7_UNCEI